MKLSVFTLLLAASGSAQVDYTHFPTPTPEDVGRGEKLFKSQCAVCHGQNGDGGKGANLVRPKLAYAVDDTMLFRAIRRGIPGTEMPGFGQMSDKEVWQVACHVKKLGQTKPEPLSGDRAQGAHLYSGKGNCSACHMINGAGGRLGPPLDNIGGRRAPSHLRQSIVEPEADVPEDFLYLRLNSGGKAYTGVRVNEDTFSLQMLDTAEKFHSFWKRDILEITRMRGKTPMPSYRSTLTPAEVEDVVAYLSSLRGGK